MSAETLSKSSQQAARATSRLPTRRKALAERKTRARFVASVNRAYASPDLQDETLRINAEFAKLARQ